MVESTAATRDANVRTYTGNRASTMVGHVNMVARNKWPKLRKEAHFCSLFDARTEQSRRWRRSAKTEPTDQAGDRDRSGWACMNYLVGQLFGYRDTSNGHAIRTMSGRMVPAIRHLSKHDAASPIHSTSLAKNETRQNDQEERNGIAMYHTGKIRVPR